MMAMTTNSSMSVKPDRERDAAMTSSGLQRVVQEGLSAHRTQAGVTRHPPPFELAAAAGALGRRGPRVRWDGNPAHHRLPRPGNGTGPGVSGAGSGAPPPPV